MEEFLEGHKNNSSDWIVTGTNKFKFKFIKY